MEEFISELNRYPNGTKIIVEIGENVKVKANLDTIYETDNGIELDKEGYEEYFACTIKIILIEKNLTNRIFRVGGLLELSKYNKPTKICLENGWVIWKSN